MTSGNRRRGARHASFLVCLQAEAELRSDYERAKGDSRLAWDEAKGATRAAWHRVERAMPGDVDGDGR